MVEIDVISPRVGFRTYVGPAQAGWPFSLGAITVCAQTGVASISSASTREGVNLRRGGGESGQLLHCFYKGMVEIPVIILVSS